MIGKTHTIIHGKILRSYLMKRDMNMAFKIDPAGVNVVAMTMIHNDGAEMRAIMYLKLLNDDKPHETNLTFPIKEWFKMNQVVDEFGKEIPSAPSN
jgi:hypothetical protein